MVKPNEITMERPFIRHNIDFTRRAYKLHRPFIETRRFGAGRDITPEVVKGNEKILQNIRLWDWHPLLDNLQEQQEIRLYLQELDRLLGRLGKEERKKEE